MIARVQPVVFPSIGQLQKRFLDVLPRIQAHARIFFRDLRCSDKRADCISEVTALCWKWYLRLAAKGKDPTHFISRMAAFAARAVRCGRRLCGQERIQDVLSAAAQRRHGFVVGDIHGNSSSSVNPLSEALRDNTATPPDEQAGFRIDFRDWQKTLTERDRRLVDDLMVGERTFAVSRKFGVSPGRISQKRREFDKDWHRFQGE